jgi:hypothetical protein
MYTYTQPHTLGLNSFLCTVYTLRQSKWEEEEERKRKRWWYERIFTRGALMCTQKITDIGMIEKMSIVWHRNSGKV